MKKSLSVLVFLALVTGAYGTTYYVSTSGSDSNPGTLAQPWATLQKAVDTIAAGDTAIVLPGTYVGCRARYSGASGAPKTLIAQTAGTVLVNTYGPVNRRQSNVEIQHDDGVSAVSYWTIQGFEVANAVKWGIDGITAHNLTVRYCTAHHNGLTTAVTGIFSAFGNYNLIEDNVSYSNGEHGIYVNNSSDNGILRRNLMYSNVSLGVHMNGDLSMGGDGIMSSWLIEKNICHDNVNGFDGDGVEYSTWKNNLAYDNSSKGIHLTCADGGIYPRYDKVYNNTLVTKPGAYVPLNFYYNKRVKKSGGNNNDVINNILYNADYTNPMRGSMIYVTTWMSTLTSNYNVVVDRFGLDDNKTTYTLAQWQSQFGKDVNSVLCQDLSALFVDPANKNFHLKSTSPAVNAGTTLSDVTDDINGTARPIGSAYDCGCYEQY
jgi:parallel beta-helix repeat protein